jgi:hypothetical protein
LAAALFLDAGVIFGAAACFVAVFFFFGSATAALAFLRAATGGAAFALAGVARPVLALAMASSPLSFSIEISIDAMTPLFQEGITKLIADGLPTLTRTPVGIRPPVSESIANTVMSSLSWLAA